MGATACREIRRARLCGQPHALDRHSACRPPLATQHRLCREGRSRARARASAASSSGTGRSRCAAASPTGSPSARCSSPRASGRVVGLFVEGTRLKTGRPGTAQPGAAMVAIQAGVPVIPMAIYGTQFWKPGNLRRARSRSASRCASTTCRRTAAGTRRRRSRSSGASTCSSTGSPRCTRRAARKAWCPPMMSDQCCRPRSSRST